MAPGGSAASTGTGGTAGGSGGTSGNAVAAQADRRYRRSKHQCRDVAILLKPSRGLSTRRIMFAVDRSKSVNDWNGWEATVSHATMALLGDGVQFV